MSRMKNIAAAMINFFPAFAALAQTLPSVPNTITYQGSLSDLAYTIVPEGEYEFTFMIFDAAAGGNLLWSETHPGVPVSSGTKAGYNVSLGQSEPLEFSMFNGKNAWLEVRIFGESVAPRRRIVSVPFALKAEGEVPEGGIILGQNSGDAAILDLGYTQEVGTVSALYPYKKKAYDQSPSRVPTLIAYQGRLEPLAGSTVGAAANLTFTLHDADTLGTAVWTETQTDVPLRDWLFSVDLGAVNPLDPTFLAGKDRWLSVTYKGQTLSPRQKLTSAAYALKIQSPVPPGGIVLSGASVNPDLTAKKFSLFPGATVKGRYPFIKSAFSASDPSVPLLINYQGRLTDPINGAPLSADTIDMRLALYDASIAGNLLYSETINDVPLSLGVFDVLLGVGDTLTPNTFTSPNAFLALTLTKNGSTEGLLPRQRLTSLPFALTAEGAMPPTALILGATSGDSLLRNAGFQMTGDTIKSYYIYAKTDVDTTPPTLTIVGPTPDSGFVTPSVPATITFSDALAGIDLNSFQAFLDGVTVTSSFTLSGQTATGSITASLGENMLSVRISDRQGNRSTQFVYYFMDSTGTLPEVNIAVPADGSIIHTDTPIIDIELSDAAGGLNFSTLLIMVNGVDRTTEFAVETIGELTHAIWPVPYEFRFSPGSNTISASIGNYVALVGSGLATVQMTNPGAPANITGMTPGFGFFGDTITITGTGFSNTIDDILVFFKTMKQAEVISASATQIVARVPQGAISGPVRIYSKNQYALNPLTFTIGVFYGFVTNYNNAWNNPPGVFPSVAVIDSDSTPGNKINQIPLPAGSRPFDVDVSPDGRFAYVTDMTGNRVFVINASVADSETSSAILKTISVPGPQYVKVSPDGLELLVGSNNGSLYRIRNLKILDSDSLGASGGTVNDIDVSPTEQKAYVAKSRGPNVAGETYIASIDRADQNSNILSVSKVQGTNYRNPVGVMVKPWQNEVYIANNSSNGGGDAYSFSVLDATATSFKRTQGATVPPSSDQHDISHPYNMIFDPRGQFFYATFSNGQRAAHFWPTNNVGFEKWPSNNTNFHGATDGDTSGSSNEWPHGIAASPDGRWIFSADLGLGPGRGNHLTILNHYLVKQAVDNDPNDSSYNLNDSPAVSLDSTVVMNKYPGIWRVTGVTAFDGPRNIAFQQIPIIEIYPHVVHLAKGGVAPGSDIIRAQVHSVFGPTVHVGLSNGSSTDLGPNLSVAFTPQWLAPNRRIFSTSSAQPANVKLSPASGDTGGIGKIIATTNGFPSNVAFVTFPPQNNIQMLVGEIQIERADNRITQMSLMSVVKNRLRLPENVDPEVYGDSVGGVPYDFPGYQVRPDNADEEYITDQMKNSITCKQYSPACVEGTTTAGEWRYWYAATRQKLLDVHKDKPYFLQFMNAYDQAVRYAGMAQLDLLRTGMDLDLLADPTIGHRQGSNLPEDGCFSFYSPEHSQWISNPGDGKVSIAEVLEPDTTDGPITQFPQAGAPNEGLEAFFVCGGKAMLFNLCNKHHEATHIQIVVPRGISTHESGRPDFIFFRLRKADEPSVVYGITAEAQ
jgi:DNA-binding beta-propeller fold protein YncE